MWKLMRLLISFYKLIYENLLKKVSHKPRNDYCTHHIGYLWVNQIGEKNKRWYWSPTNEIWTRPSGHSRRGRGQICSDRHDRTMCPRFLRRTSASARGGDRARGEPAAAAHVPRAEEARAPVVVPLRRAQRRPHRLRGRAEPQRPALPVARPATHHR